MTYVDDVALTGGLVRAFGDELAYGRTDVEGPVWLISPGCPKEPPARASMLAAQVEPTTVNCKALIRVDRLPEAP